MKVLVTGATGQLGTDISKELEKREIEYAGINSRDCDITSLKAVERVISNISPEIIIHCAAYTAVDKAEEEAEKCYMINGKGTENVVKVCKELGITLVYISTDYVFDGTGERPWRVDDERFPMSVYGKSKYMGEKAVEEILKKYFIIRVSWIYGKHGSNFVKAILKKSETEPCIKVVADQIGTPTYTADIAKTIVEIIKTDKYGVYHVANEGYCSWYEFARSVFEKVGRDVEVLPIASEEYSAKAKRPLNSRLDKSVLVENGFSLLPSWEDALERFLAEYWAD